MTVEQIVQGKVMIVTVIGEQGTLALDSQAAVTGLG